MNSSHTVGRVLLTTLLLCTVAQSQVPPDDLEGDAFRAWLRKNFYEGQHQHLGYRNARRAMYNFIDNRDDRIVGVYGGYERRLRFGGNVSNPGPINAEHTVPQSFFDEDEPMRSDLYHLFPTYNRWNSTRNNHPFREIPDDEATKWMVLDRYQADVPGADVDSYSEYANWSFEPPEDHKGNVARAVFYFYSMYPNFDLSRVGDIDMFYAWHHADPVDERERDRNDAIEERQGNRNPFIDQPEWVLRAWPTIRLDEATAVLEAMGLDILLEAPEADLFALKPVEDLRIHSLNVGAGSCHVIECPGNTSPILYDCGRTGRSFPDMTDDLAINYVSSIFDRYDEDPIVIISHGDSDHFLYVPQIMEGRIARALWFGGLRKDYPGWLRDWFAAQEKSGTSVVGGIDALPAGFFNNGEPVPALRCGQASTYILSVNAGSTKNSRSLIARIEHGNFSVTLTGDATRETQDSATSNFDALQTTLLIGSHHGASTHGSNSLAWADALEPAITLFSSGTSFGHPRCVSTKRYENSLLNVSPHETQCGISNTRFRESETRLAQYVTRVNGTVVISSDGESPPEIECSLTDDCGF